MAIRVINIIFVDSFANEDLMNTTEKIPGHIAIIMDGNGRWARERGLERYEGHRQGVSALRNIIRSAAQYKGLRYMTLYVFSTENWGRPKEEVDMLMELLCRSIVNELPELKQEHIRVLVIGDRHGMSQTVTEHIDLIERETASGDALTMLLCINYSSRAELTHAMQTIAAKAAAGEINPDEIDADTITSALYTSGIPDPDLIIRTGGEQRLSNFLLWQGAYSELYFTQTYWPDFGPADLDAAIKEYAHRNRRFGKVCDDKE